MLDKLEQIKKRYEELNKQIALPEVATDPKQLQKLAQERASVEKVATKYNEYQATSKALEDTLAMLNDGLDEQMTALVKQEIENLQSQQEQLLQELKLALIPQDPNDEKDIIMEIRAGAGGDEAGLFAASNESGIGAFKEIVFEIKGKGAYSQLKYEMGVHRVQRVPVTESTGRIHTSTATVAVLPEADDVEISVNPDDLKIDIFHSGGAGGQNVNKVATAVRITHLPTGIVTTCQDERSQLRNKLKAMSVLRARLLDIEQRKQDDAITKQRRSQVGTGDRSEKIRTYNFPQDRVTDHRISRTFHNLPRILEGGLDEIIDALTTNAQARKLEE